MTRITAAEAEKLFDSADIMEIGARADELRRRLHPANEVTYIVDRNINYSNICGSGCSFCAFYRTTSSSEAYCLTYSEIKEKIEETLAQDGVQILMQGGLHPDWKIEEHEELLRRIKSDFKIHMHAFSPPEIVHMSRRSKIPVKETIERLIEAGLDSIPGGGAEILVDRIRSEISPNKCSADEWLDVMRTAHLLGLKTTATMMFGHIETIQDRIEHLEKIRRLQDETGGFTAFIPWQFQPANTKLGKSGVKKKTGSLDYLKTLAISRLMLANVPNIQASWVTMGAKVAQMSLFFGANDMGSTMLEENVVKAAGTSFRMSENEIRRVIEDAGFSPRRRKQDYSLLPEPVGV